MLRIRCVLRWCLRGTLVAVVGFIALLGGLGDETSKSGEAIAEPRFALRVGARCTMCHVNPTGGAMRNRYGREVFELHDLPLDTKLKGWLARTPFTPQVTDWLALGGDLRFAYLFTKLGAKPPGKPKFDPVVNNTFFLMQAALYVSATVTKWLTVYLDIGAAMPKKGQKIRKKLKKKVGVYHLNCDVGHTWMKSYIHVFNHPYYAVTSKSGAFNLSNVPAGLYKVVAWHEKLGTKTFTVKVAAGKASKLSIKF